MKAILEFNLEEPEDRMALLRCVKARDMAAVLFELTHNTGRKCETVDDVFDELNELLESHNINIGELIE